MRARYSVRKEITKQQIERAQTCDREQTACSSEPLMAEALA